MALRADPVTRASRLQLHGEIAPGEDGDADDVRGGKEHAAARRETMIFLGRVADRHRVRARVNSCREDARGGECSVAERRRL